MGCMGSHVLAAPTTIKMENQISLQFMIKMLDVMKGVSSDQEEAYVKYDKELKSLLMDARELQRKHHLAEQKGMRGDLEREKTYEEGRELLEKTIVETETYLQTLLKGLKEHREKIKTSLLPKPEKK